MTDSSLNSIQVVSDPIILSENTNRIQNMLYVTNGKRLCVSRTICFDGDHGGVIQDCRGSEKFWNFLGECETQHSRIVKAKLPGEPITTFESI